jgi:hypothetical protein
MCTLVLEIALLTNAESLPCSLNSQSILTFLIYDSNEQYQVKGSSHIQFQFYYSIFNQLDTSKEGGLATNTEESKCTSKFKSYHQNVEDT